MKKRLLSLALCLALCLGLLPVGVLATDGESGGVYVPPGGQTEGGGGTYIPPEDTRTDDSESKIENSNYIPANKVESIIGMYRAAVFCGENFTAVCVKGR